MAALTQSELSAVGFAPVPGARPPPGLMLTDEAGSAVTLPGVLAGRPGVLVFADYRCTALCGTALAITAASLERTGLRPGGDYVLVALGIRPGDGAADAAAMKATELGDSPVAASAVFLTGPPYALAGAQSAFGYAARWDAGSGQFAHPVGVLVLTPEGAVSRLLGGLDLDPQTLRLALIEASSGRVGTIAERFRLLCYGFDAARGEHSALILRLFQMAAVGTVLGLGGLIVVLARRRV